MLIPLPDATAWNSDSKVGASYVILGASLSFAPLSEAERKQLHALMLQTLGGSWSQQLQCLTTQLSAIKVLGANFAFAKVLEFGIILIDQIHFALDRRFACSQASKRKAP
jgi:hypothetical protein